MFNSVAIPVSDEESDDLAGRTRFRHRKKRRKPGFLAKGDGGHWISRQILRWWPVLIFFPAIIFLLFQASSIGGDSPNLNRQPDFALSEEEHRGNLNHLHPMTRKVGGVRERVFSNSYNWIFFNKQRSFDFVGFSPPPLGSCHSSSANELDNGYKNPRCQMILQILPPEQIEHLGFPVKVEPDFPVNRVVYRSGSEDSKIRVDGRLPRESTEATRFNLFTGNQTMEEREDSFKVNETVVVNCGFYSDIGGFKISDEDKAYMKSCKAVVSTCAFGGGDDLYQPIGMTEASLREVCYVAFWDEITHVTQEAEGKKIDEAHMIGKWRIVVVRDLPFTDQRLNGKIPKMLSHRLFPQARYSIWVDSKSQFRRDPLGVLEALLWRTNSVLAISEHGARSNVYDEGNAIVRKHKATPEEVEMQLNQYRRDGFPNDNRFNGKKALSEASVIVREHTPLSNLLMCLWFNEVVRFTSRDQLSFPYVLRRLKVVKINMFPVCTRKDLVNSMGHKRKVKPLVA